MGFSVLNSRTSGYTARNHRREQVSNKRAVDLFHFAVKYEVGEIGEHRRPGQKEMV